MTWGFTRAPLMAALLIGALAAAQTSKAAGPQPINDLQRSNISAKAAQNGWYVKDSWVNHLSQQQVKGILGLQNPPDSEAEFSAIPTGSELRSDTDVLDWRAKDGVNWVSPVLNQGNCGSCVAFASVGTLETQVNIASTIPGLNPRFSAQALFSCGGAKCDWGWTLGGAASYLQKSGIPDESCMPYQSGVTGEDVACSAECGNAASRSQKIARSFTPSSFFHNAAKVKAALQKGPLVTTLTVYTDFLVYGGGVYKHATGKAEGGHAVSIIGYDDSKQAWIIRNSWGPEWGMNGFAYVSYDDDSGVGNSTVGFEIPPVTGYVALQSPRVFNALAGEADIAGLTNMPGATGINFNISKGAGDQPMGATIATVSCSGQTCSAKLDTTKLADGIYSITTAATDRSRVLGTGTPETVSISNGKPQMSISFKGDASLDLTKPLTDRIVFDIVTASKPVPMTSVKFHYRGHDGVEHVKVVPQVMDAMTMGWRTNQVANDSYEIWFSGHLTTNLGDNETDSTHINVQTLN